MSDTPIIDKVQALAATATPSEQSARFLYEICIVAKKNPMFGELIEQHLRENAAKLNLK